MKAYSEDLRGKIIQAVGGGMSKSQAARHYGVSLNSVKRYVKLHQNTGQLSPKPRPGRGVSIGGEKLAVFRAQVKEQPDATLAERAENWAQTQGVKLSRSTFSRTLKRLKITYKKKV